MIHLLFGGNWVNGDSVYVIIVYDVKVERVNKVKSFLRQHLYWIQNSVFEGDLTKSGFKLVINGLKDIIDEEEDSVIIYKMMMEESLNREVLGIEKSPIEEIL